MSIYNINHILTTLPVWYNHIPTLCTGYTNEKAINIAIKCSNIARRKQCSAKGSTADF